MGRYPSMVNAWTIDGTLLSLVQSRQVGPRSQDLWP